MSLSLAPSTTPVTVPETATSVSGVEAVDALSAELRAGRGEVDARPVAAAAGRGMTFRAARLKGA